MPFKVVIVGGGLVGALASVYFAKRGVQVELYELRPDIRLERASAGRSINLALSVRGLAALEGAGVDGLIKPTLIPLKGRMLHTLSGLVSQLYGDFGECIQSVDRKLMNERLLTAAEAYPNVKLHFETSLVSSNVDSGSLCFKTKQGQVEVSGVDLVIGADGAYSKTRSELSKKVRLDFSQEYIDHGYVELCMPATQYGEFAMDPHHLHIWPRQTFMMIALPNIDKSFTVTLFMPWEKFDGIKTESDLFKFFDVTFPDSVPLITRKLLAYDYFKNIKGSLMTVKAKPYHYQNRLVILGDAAHAMVPFYGQGMNCGFEDVLVLDEIITKHVGTGLLTQQSMGPVLEEFTEIRTVDAVAICDLALHNYIEMRSSVTDFSYVLRKKVEGVLHKWMPSLVVPLYTMVSFSRIRYSEVVRRNERQTWWFHFALGSGHLAVASILGWSLFKLAKHQKFI